MDTFGAPKVINGKPYYAQQPSYEPTDYGNISTPHEFEEVISEIREATRPPERITVDPVNVDPARLSFVGIRTVINQRRIDRQNNKILNSGRDDRYITDLAIAILNQDDYMAKPVRGRVLRPGNWRQNRLLRKIDNKRGQMAHGLGYNNHMHREFYQSDATKSALALDHGERKARRKAEKSAHTSMHHFEKASEKLVKIAAPNHAKNKKRREKIAELEEKRIALEKARGIKQVGKANKANNKRVRKTTSFRKEATEVIKSKSLIVDDTARIEGTKLERDINNVRFSRLEKKVDFNREVLNGSYFDLMSDGPETPILDEKITSALNPMKRFKLREIRDIIDTAKAKVTETGEPLTDDERLELRKQISEILKEKKRLKQHRDNEQKDERLSRQLENAEQDKVERKNRYEAVKRQYSRGHHLRKVHGRFKHRK